MSHKDVLLLGGAGFIGSALARRLEREKINAHVLGRHDAKRLENVLPRCGTVVHLVSATTPGSSGVTVYGNPEKLPVAEGEPIAPLSNYGAGKAALEAFCHAFHAAGHAVTILRPSNAYGPGQNMRGGFGLIRTLLGHALAGTAMEIWGDGENVRDFIYIDDAVEACVRFIALPQDSGTYNLGSGRGYSVNHVRRIVEEVTGIELKVSHRAARGIDVRAVVLGIDRISQELNWVPKWS